MYRALLLAFTTTCAVAAPTKPSSEPMAAPLPIRSMCFQPGEKLVSTLTEQHMVPNMILEGNMLDAKNVQVVLFINKATSEWALVSAQNHDLTVVCVLATGDSFSTAFSHPDIPNAPAPKD